MKSLPHSAVPTQRKSVMFEHPRTQMLSTMNAATVVFRGFEKHKEITFSFSSVHLYERPRLH